MFDPFEGPRMCYQSAIDKIAAVLVDHGMRANCALLEEMWRAMSTFDDAYPNQLDARLPEWKWMADGLNHLNKHIPLAQVRHLVRDALNVDCPDERLSTGWPPLLVAAIKNRRAQYAVEIVLQAARHAEKAQDLRNYAEEISKLLARHDLKVSVRREWSQRVITLTLTEEDAPDFLAFLRSREK